jgi:hypothetical protein
MSSVATLTTEFQTASGSNVSIKTVYRKLHEMGFHGRAAAHKPKITMRNTKHRLDWGNVLPPLDSGAVEMQSSDLNSIEHLWDELEHQMQRRSNHPTSMPNLTSRRRGQYRCIKAGTESLKNSFYLKAISLLNSHH